MKQYKNQICILTNYGFSVGSGHLKRSINLGNFLLTKGYTITIVTKIIDINIKKIIPQSFKSLEVGSFKKNELIHKIDIQTYNFFVTDLLVHDLNDLLWIREMNTYIVSILSFKTDISSKLFDIAFFPSIEKNDEISENDRNIYVGKNCVLLNPFLEKREFQINDKVKSVLIFLGGTDPYNITNLVLKDLIQNDCNLKFNILSKTNLSYPKNFNFKGQVKNFYNELINNDIAIINGGISRYECIHVGIPTIAISIHKKQFNITKQVSNMGAMINLGIYNELKNNSVSKTLLRLVNSKEERISLYTNSKNVFRAPIENYEFILKTIINEKNN